jgi:uncharacterized membrane protein
MEYNFIPMLGATILVGLFLVTVYYGMHRFASRRHYLIYAAIQGLFLSAACWFCLSANARSLMSGALFYALYLVIRDFKKVKILFNASRINRD